MIENVLIVISSSNPINYFILIGYFSLCFLRMVIGTMKFIFININIYYYYNIFVLFSDRELNQNQIVYTYNIVFIL